MNSDIGGGIYTGVELITCGNVQCMMQCLPSDMEANVQLRFTSFQQGTQQQWYTRGTLMKPYPSAAGHSFPQRNFEASHGLYFHAVG